MLMQLMGIEKTFVPRNGAAPTKVLRGIDLTVEEGEMIAIKGASGAGKSTLLHILGCLDRPTKGTYLLNGQDIALETPARLSVLRNREFGFVMQHFALVEEDTALQNVQIPLLFAHVKRSRMEGMAMDRLRELGVEHLAKKKAAKLSGGEKQRVAIARALVNQPQVILADEPTGALDRENSETVLRIFRDLNAQGKTIIIVTHEPFVAASCDRVVTISDGRIL